MPGMVMEVSAMFVATTIFLVVLPHLSNTFIYITKHYSFPSYFNESFTLYYQCSDFARLIGIITVNNKRYIEVIVFKRYTSI